MSASGPSSSLGRRNTHCPSRLQGWFIFVGYVWNRGGHIFEFCSLSVEACMPFESEQLARAQKRMTEDPNNSFLASILL